MGGRRNRIRKIITRVIVFLLLGAIVNVAVAWGCAYWLSPPTDLRSVWIGFVPLDVPVWQCIGWQRTGTARVMSRPFEDADADVRDIHAIMKSMPLSDDPVPDWSRIVETRFHPRINNPRVLVEDARGWPLMAMMCEFGRSSYLLDVLGVQVERYSGIALPDGTADIMDGDRHRALPLRPIWPGFAINALFYAGILWLLFVAPFALRRRRRIKRGLCPACAYPVGNSDVCTECGKPVKVRT
jgi:hypothetical protein